MLRYVQKAPDDVRWTVDETEFDDLLALKKGLAPGPYGTSYGAPRCAGCLGSQFLYNAHTALFGSRYRAWSFCSVELFLPSRPLTSMTMEGSFHHQTNFVLWQCAVAIANFLLPPSVEAFTGSPWDAYILHRNVSLPHRWKTFLRFWPPLWPTLHAFRKNQVAFSLMLLPLILVSITVGS